MRRAAVVSLLLPDSADNEAFCPHCQLLVAADVAMPWPGRPQRCPHCQLLIGSGRALAEPSAEPGAKGTAAGVFSRQAKREGASENPAAPAEVLAAIRAVAEKESVRADRLLMVDYQQRAAVDDSLPPLGDVFEAFGSWKSARRAAAE